jgi:hypothetical protein
VTSENEPGSGKSHRLKLPRGLRALVHRPS